MKVGPEETPKLPYLRFASVTLHPSNEDLSMAIGSMLRSFGYPTTSIICAKAECEFPVSPSSSFYLEKQLPVPVTVLFRRFPLSNMLTSFWRHAPPSPGGRGQVVCLCVPTV